MPENVSNPPRKVVVRRPSLSTRMPEMGENRKVAPIVSDPTRAVQRESRKKSIFSHEEVQKSREISGFFGCVVLTVKLS
jgi:hypothetical protein